MDQDFWRPAIKATAFAVLMALGTWYGRHASLRTPRISKGRMVVEHPHGYAGACASLLIFLSYFIVRDFHLNPVQSSQENDLLVVILITMTYSIFIFFILLFHFYSIEFDGNIIQRNWLWSKRTWRWEEAVEMTTFLGSPMVRFASGKSIYVSNLARGYVAFLQMARLKNVTIGKDVEAL